MKPLADIIKSKSDKNTYKAVELLNKLRVIFVKTTNNVAGACLTVNRGSANDPLKY